MSKIKYRIVTEEKGTYAIEFKVWWWPWWIHYYGGFKSFTEADYWLLQSRNRKKFKSEVVKEYD